MQDHEISCEQAEKWLGTDAAVLVDVREEHEFSEMRVPGAVNHPLSCFDPQVVIDLAAGRKIVFMCRSGKRADDIRQYFAGHTGQDAWCMAGSMLGWHQAGYPVESGQPESIKAV